MAVERLPHSGHVATHTHMHYGRVSVMYVQGELARIHDGWHAWTVDVNSLDPIIGPADAYVRH